MIQVLDILICHTFLLYTVSRVAKWYEAKSLFTQDYNRIVLLSSIRMLTHGVREFYLSA
jgi:hypothetical protein